MSPNPRSKPANRIDTAREEHSMNTGALNVAAASGTRREFLETIGRATASALALGASHRTLFAAAPAVIRGKLGKAKPRPDLVEKNSPKGVEVIQLTTEPDVPASHLYMEAQIFTMDSKRLVLHRSASAHGGSKSDPKHQYLLCDLEDGCSLRPLTEELGATAATVSPDGKYVYYFVDETQVGGGRLTLKRVGLDGSDRQTIVVLDEPLPDTNFRPSHIYPLSTISSDGKRLAISAFFGDGKTENAPFGLMVFDLQKPGVRAVIHGQTWCNVHPQYCRSTDPEASHDILIQENHGNVCDAKGSIKVLVAGQGADIHVIRDDGTNFRNMPWGRDGNEACQGHQCWRGRSTWAITSTGTRKPPEAQLIEGLAAPFTDHVGIQTPGGVRNDLSHSFPPPALLPFRNGHRRQSLDHRFRPERPARRHLSGRTRRPRPRPSQEIHLSHQPPILMAKGRPRPPVPLARRQDRILQFGRIGHSTGVYDSRAAERLALRRIDCHRNGIRRCPIAPDDNQVGLSRVGQRQVRQF